MNVGCLSVQRFLFGAFRLQLSLDNGLYKIAVRETDILCKTRSEVEPLAYRMFGG